MTLPAPGCMKKDGRSKDDSTSNERLDAVPGWIKKDQAATVYARQGSSHLDQWKQGIIVTCCDVIVSEGVTIESRVIH